MIKNKKYLITGGGKCGTHFVTKYLSNFCDENFEVYLPEVRSLEEALELKKINKDLVVHSIFISKQDVINNIKKFVDNDFEIILLERYPPQHYLAWYYTLFDDFVTHPKVSYEHNRMKKHYIQWCFDHIEASIELKKYSNRIIQIENFTNDFDERKHLVNHITNKNIAIDDELSKDFLVSKSIFGPSNEIIKITYERYPNSFVASELAILQDYFSENNFNEVYKNEFHKLSEVGNYSLEFFRNRMLFYHKIFYKGKKTEKPNISFFRYVYYRVLKNKIIFYLFCRVKFLTKKMNNIK